MGDDSQQTERKQQAQSYMPASAHFNTSAGHTNLPRTPYLALRLEEQMRDDIEYQVRALYGSGRDGALIPTCMYGDALEPISGAPWSRAVAAVDNHNSLQILLISVNGRTIRKDGVPYHVIWSSDLRDTGMDRIVRDDTYYWPVKEMRTERVQDAHNRFRHVFNTIEKNVRYERVLSAVEMEAEALARDAHMHLADRMSFMSEKFDFLTLDIPLEIPPVDWGNTIHPFACRVEDIDGKRHITFV